jgi:hypothetical protein
VAVVFSGSVIVLLIAHRVCDVRSKDEEKRRKAIATSVPSYSGLYLFVQWVELSRRPVTC